MPTVDNVNNVHSVHSVKRVNDVEAAGFARGVNIGDILDTVLERLKPNARVVICGGISQYDGNLNHGKVRENQEFCQFEVHMSLFTLIFCRYKDHRII